MAAPAQPYNFNIQSANREIFLSWDISVGATSYDIQRSTDGVTYASYATVSVNNYLDTAVSVGTQYYYQIASVNGDGTSPYTDPLTAIPAPTSELSLGQLRLLSQQKADRVGSEFVTLPEWNNFINLAMYELYDLLIATSEDYYIATPVQFTTDASVQYALPNGANTFTNGLTGATGYVAEPFYKLKGVDLAVSSANNAWVTLSKFNFIDRNKYLYPNSASTIYGVYNLQYRIMGNSIQFIPKPSGNQIIQLWYIPRLRELVKDTDLTTLGISGWLQYVIVRAAKYALDKEESDTSKLDQELVYLKQRIEESAANRDQGQPDTISDIRSSGPWGYGNGWNGPIGGGV